MRRCALVAVATASLMMFPSIASAKTLYFDGTAKGDPETLVTFQADGKLKKGKKKKKFVAKQVSVISVENQPFTCYQADGSPSGLSGRFTYAFSAIEPTKVKNGKFSGVESYTPPGGEAGGPVEVNEFKGKIKNRKATGTYQAKYDPGGINNGYCGDKDPVEWEANGLDLQPAPLHG